MGPVVVFAGLWALLCALGAWRHPLAVRRGDPSWEPALVEELAQAASDADKLVAINEALDDAEHLMSRGERWPVAMGWLIAAGCAIAAVAVGLSHAWLSFAGVLALALAGIGLCAAAKITAGRWAKRERERIDVRVQALAGPLYDAELALPARGRRRFLRQRAR